MYVTDTCARCLVKDGCDKIPASGEVALFNTIEIEIHYGEFIGRLLIGKCRETDKVVAHDLGRQHPQGTHVTENVVHEMRLRGLESLLIDLASLETAPEAPLVVTDAMRAFPKPEALNYNPAAED